MMSSSPSPSAPHQPDELFYQAPDRLLPSNGKARQPTGTMAWHISGIPFPLPVDEMQQRQCQAIEIVYTFPRGIQHCFHPNPGTPYRSNDRNAYLPDTPQGRRLLKRLQDAFMRGYVFEIGTSVTTGERNVVLWSGFVPHKTVLHVEGEFGWGGMNSEDMEEYFTWAHMSLTVLKIPRAELCGRHDRVARTLSQSDQSPSLHPRCRSISISTEGSQSSHPSQNGGDDFVDDDALIQNLTAPTTAASADQDDNMTAIAEPTGEFVHLADCVLLPPNGGGAPGAMVFPPSPPPGSPAVAAPGSPSSTTVTLILRTA